MARWGAVGDEQAFILVFPDGGNREAHLLCQDADGDQRVFGVVVGCRVGHSKKPFRCHER
jgi:hypothetical protein